MEINKESLNDFQSFISSLDVDIRQNLSEDYLNFCKETVGQLKYNPCFYFISKSHICFRYEKYNRILNIELSDNKSLDIFDKSSNSISSISSFYSMKNFTVERLNQIIEKFVERSENG